MSRIEGIAREISVLGPMIGRKITFDFFQELDIPQSQIFTILILNEKQSCNFSDLSKELNISAPTSTGIIDRMEKSNLARRVPDKNDRRAINVELTDNGKKIAKDLKSTIVKRWKKILENLTVNEREEFLKILRKVIGFKL